MKTVRSQRWGYVRIIIGTVVGGLAGFYVMHRLETNYKAKWDERLKKYEEELMLKENTRIQQSEDTLYFSDDPKSDQSSNKKFET